MLQISLVVVGVSDDRADRIAEREQRDPDQRKIVERVVEPVLEADQPVRHARVRAGRSLGQVIEVDLRGGERVEGREVVGPEVQEIGRNAEVGGDRQERVTDAVNRCREADVVLRRPRIRQRGRGRIANRAVTVNVYARALTVPAGAEQPDQRHRPEPIERAHHERGLIAQGQRRDGGRVRLLDRLLGGRRLGVRGCSDQLRRTQEVRTARQRVVQEEGERANSKQK